MLQSWNQFCFQGGYIEVSVSLPGSNQNTGFVSHNTVPYSQLSTEATSLDAPGMLRCGAETNGTNSLNRPMPWEIWLVRGMEPRKTEYCRLAITHVMLL